MITIKLTHPYKTDTIAYENIVFKYAISKNDLTPIFYCNKVFGFGGKLDMMEFTFHSIKFNTHDNVKIKDSIREIVEGCKIFTILSPPLKNTSQVVSIDSGSIAPNWKVKLFKGDSVSLMKLTNKVIILDFWYVRCYPCQLAIPYLCKLYSKFKDKGLLIIGLDPYDSKDTSLFIKEINRLEIQYPLLLDCQEVARSYGITAYPTLILLDRNKRIIYKKIGYNETDKNIIEKIIEKEIY